MKTLLSSTLLSFVTTVLLAISLPPNPLAAAEAEGTWTKAEVKTKGSWSLEGRTLKLTGLSTSSAPDLKLILSPHTVGELQSRNAMTDAVVISPLKSHRGDQIYSIPADVDLTKYRSIGIHCQQYTKLFAKSAL